jgi:hypothetical protein
MSAVDVSDTIVAKSDQLNSDDLIGGPITVTITSVKRSSSGDQPVDVHISGGHQPWKPCKTMRRVLVQAWGKDANQWIGKSLTLKRDPTVKWAGEAVGGIRIHAMSHIEKPLDVSLTETRGKKKRCVIEKIDTKPSADLAATFKAMKDRWKSRREDRGLAVGENEFRSWVCEATESLISVADAMRLEKHTAETIAQCEKVIRETMPQ